MTGGSPPRSPSQSRLQEPHFLDPTPAWARAALSLCVRLRSLSTAPPRPPGGMPLAGTGSGRSSVPSEPGEAAEAPAGDVLTQGHGHTERQPRDSNPGSPRAGPTSSQTRSLQALLARQTDKGQTRPRLPLPGRGSSTKGPTRPSWPSSQCRPLSDRAEGSRRLARGRSGPRSKGTLGRTQVLGGGVLLPLRGYWGPSRSLGAEGVRRPHTVPTCGPLTGSGSGSRRRELAVLPRVPGCAPGVGSWSAPLLALAAAWPWAAGVRLRACAARWVVAAAPAQAFPSPGSPGPTGPRESPGSPRRRREQHPLGAGRTPLHCGRPALACLHGAASPEPPGPAWRWLASWESPPGVAVPRTPR